MKNEPKKYEELTFTDDFIFCKILQNNEEVCKELLELILGKKIRFIHNPENQKTIKITEDGKGIRLDIYVENDETVVYDVEMQTSPKRNLAKRSRYYQGMIDLNLIEKGADYNELKKSYVIFICTFDYFEKGLHKYTFSNRCHELPEIDLEDDTRKIFLNAAGTADDVSEDMKAFLNYLNNQKAENEFTKSIDKAVGDARNSEKWRIEYMTMHMRDWDMKAEGREEGRTEKLLTQICKKLAKNKSLQQIADELEEDEDTIRPLYEAAKAAAPEYDVDKIYDSLFSLKK